MSNKKTKVLFVCLGNICRSPAAEAVFKKVLQDKNITNQFHIDSAGTSGIHAGERADSRMISAAKKRNIDITSISRKFLKSDFREFDYVLVMDDSNYQNVISLTENETDIKKVSLMTDYCSLNFVKYHKVPDPYYGGEEGFEIVLDILDNACTNFFNTITNDSLK